MNSSRVSRARRAASGARGHSPVSDAEHAHGAAQQLTYHQLIHCGPCLGFPDHCEVDVAVVCFSFSIKLLPLRLVVKITNEIKIVFRANKVSLLLNLSISYI